MYIGDSRLCLLHFSVKLNCHRDIVRILEMLERGDRLIFVQWDVQMRDLLRHWSDVEQQCFSYVTVSTQNFPFANIGIFSRFYGTVALFSSALSYAHSFRHSTKNGRNHICEVLTLWERRSAKSSPSAMK